MDHTKDLVEELEVVAVINILSHVRNCLSAQSTRTLLCVSLWSELGLVEFEDIIHVSRLPDVISEEEAMDEGWDRINLETCTDISSK
jgi:hypothetical protein